jgi:ABC-type nitrate/sulfonate/bicarbonate transport system permease component
VTPPKKRGQAWLGLAGLLLFFLVWELVSRLGLVPRLFFSSPSRIVRAAVLLAQTDLWHHIAVSGLEFGLGLGLAAAFAIPLGFALGWYARLNAALDSFVQLLNATPRLALAPLIIIWLGLGLTSKVAVVFLGAFIPILLNTRASLRQLPLPLVQCARAFGARDRQIFMTVALPASVPWIITGLRLAVGHALVGVVVAELITSTAGLGYLISVSTATLQTDKVFVAVGLLAGTGLLLSKLLEGLEAYFDAWRPPA